MCSKLLTRTGKRDCACSSPRKNTRSLSLTGKLTYGESHPLDCDFHTIVLLAIPSYQAHVLASVVPGIEREVLRPEGLHRRQLHLVQEKRQICHYEWTMEHAKKTHVYQTSLIPLGGPDGEVKQILSVTKDITNWGNSSSGVLRDGPALHTFPQILIASRENEKREVAKALHDEIGSASVVLLALVSLARQSLAQGDAEQVSEYLNQLCQQIQASMERLHSIIISIRPPSLDTDGALRGSLEDLLESVCRLGRVKYRLVCEENWQEKGICDSVKILLYRVAQEALNNIIKHAHATHVFVSLKRCKSRLLLTVKDDGVGFEREKRITVKHVGLLSMRESIRSVGGRMTLQTAPGKGTCIRAVCPSIVYEENQ